MNEWVLITGMAAAIAGFVLIWLAFIGENTVMATVGGMLFGGGVVFGIFQH